MYVGPTLIPCQILLVARLPSVSLLVENRGAVAEDQRTEKNFSYISIMFGPAQPNDSVNGVRSLPCSYSFNK